MKISFYGAARTVTGSCYLLEHAGVRFLVDCGMFQGSKTLKEHNYAEFPFPPGEIDFVILTHAHVDHSGLLPKLYKHGFKNPIYASSATTALAEVMLPDSGYIQEMEVERKNRKRTRAGQPLLEPIYTAEDAAEIQKLFSPQKYGIPFNPAPGICVILRDAGHILGSAMVEIHYTENDIPRKLLFTGDLGRNDQAIVRDPEIITEADFLVMESTYGNREHHGDMEKEMPHFTSIIKSAFLRGGNVIIPAFAVDRTQDILMMIYELQKQHQIPDCTVYVDSPLAIKATEIFAKYTDYYDRLTTKLFKEEGKAPFKLDNLVYAQTTAESMELNKIKSGAIIISASGMADAGRIKHHLKHNLWRPESSVVFFGYQAEGTLGRRLIDGEKKVTIHGEEIEVKAQIHNMEGFSAHADKNELLAWLRHFQQLPQRIFVTHGEESSSLYFADLVRDSLGADTVVPQLGEVFDLSIASAAPLGAASSTDSGRRETVLMDINAALMKLAFEHDMDKLMRVRDYLEQISS